MAKKNAPNPSIALVGSDALPADVDLGNGAVVQADAVVRRAVDDADGLDEAAWNALEQADRDERITKALEALTAEAEAAVSKNSKPGNTVQCAVLHDSIYGKHDDIIELPAKDAEAASAGGYVDAHPNAIKAIRGEA